MHARLYCQSQYIQSFTFHNIRPRPHKADAMPQLNHPQLGTAPILNTLVTSDLPKIEENGTITAPTAPSVTSPSESPGSSPPSSPPTVKSVQFPSTEVTSYSRPLTNVELWPLYYFEQHARACPSCVNPYDVSKSDKALCVTGQRLGYKVTQVIYSKSDGRDIFAVRELIHQGGESDILIKVELPIQYAQVRSLLRAMERLMKCRRRAERKKFVESEEESQKRAAHIARQASPERYQPRRSRPAYHEDRHASSDDESYSSRRRHRPVYMEDDRRHGSQTKSYHEQDPPRRPRAASPVSVSSDRPSRRSTSRTYHESDLPIRQRSSSLTPGSRSYPVNIVQRPQQPPVTAPRPVPVPTQTLPPVAQQMAPMTKVQTWPDAGTRPTMNAPMPSRRSSISGASSITYPPTSWRYMPPVNPSGLGRTSSLTNGSALRAGAPAGRYAGFDQRRVQG